MRRMNRVCRVGMSAAVLGLCMSCSADYGEDQLPDRDTHPTGDSAGLVSPKTIELEPGHRVTIQRFEDGATVLTEVGSLGEHEETIADETLALPLSKLVEKLASTSPVDLRPTTPSEEAPAAGLSVRDLSGSEPSAKVDRRSNGFRQPALDILAVSHPALFGRQLGPGCRRAGEVLSLGSAESFDAR